MFSLETGARNDEEKKGAKKRLTFELLVLPPAEGWDVMHGALHS